MGSTRGAVTHIDLERDDALPPVVFQCWAIEVLTKAGLADRLRERPVVMDYEKELPCSLARILRLAREEQNLTQTELGERLSQAQVGEEADEEPVTQSWVSKAETRANPSLPRFVALAAGACKLAPSAMLLAAEVEFLLRKYGKEPATGWDSVLPVLVASLMRDVRNSKQAAVRIWQNPTPELIAKYGLAVARAIRRRRYLAGLTLAEVVERSEKLKLDAAISKPYLSGVETGAGRPSLFRLGLFARLLPSGMPVGSAHESGRGESAFARYLASPLSDLLGEAEECLVYEGSDETQKRLDDLRDKAELFFHMAARIAKSYSQGDVIHARALDAIAIIPLFEPLHSRLAAVEVPGRRPGRPRK